MTRLLTNLCDRLEPLDFDELADVGCEADAQMHPEWREMADRIIRRATQLRARFDGGARNEEVGVTLDHVEPEPVTWEWEGKLALGKIHLIEGRPDEGKTTLALDLAARETTGAPMPSSGTARREPAGVVVVTAEDGIADTIRPRLDAAGADVSRVLAPTADEIVSLDEAGLDWLRRACRRVDARLIVLDPLVALMPGAINYKDDQHVRLMLRPLRALAEECDVAVLGIRHLRKSAAISPKDAGGGSVGIGAAARVVMLAAPDPDDPDRRILARVKGNLAPPWPSLSYRLVPAGGSVKVEWLGTSTHTAETLLAPPVEQAETGALADACSVVQELLADGPMTSNDLSMAAKARGVSTKTLERARASLNVKPFKAGNTWHVRLPGDEDRQDPPTGEHGDVGDVEVGVVP